MIQLNLPTFDCKLTKIEDKPHIFDPIRRKYVALSPEEWVRQHVLNWLVMVHQYPKSLIKSESGLQVNRLSKRTDIVVYDRTTKPFLLVECKAPHILLSDDTFGQAANYNKTLNAPFILLTNGIEHLSFELKDNRFLPIQNLPPLK
jgi:Type I restriction enzyme R protein N terminus (HSDR_N)